MGEMKLQAAFARLTEHMKYIFSKLLFSSSIIITFSQGVGASTGDKTWLSPTVEMRTEVGTLISSPYD